MSSRLEPMDEPLLIGLDWGSSHLRAYLLNRAGAVLQVRTSEAGASRLALEAAPDARPLLFEQGLRALIADWLLARHPMIACGMVGSAHGWREAAYLPCPLDLRDLQRHLTHVGGSDGLELWIVPGVSFAAPGQTPDVMRGEETQICGVLGQRAQWAENVLVIMPGTHSKWVRVVDGRLTSFATRMTGELFDVLRTHSVLGRSVAHSDQFDQDAFEAGAIASRNTRGGDLSHLLFGVRTLQLFGTRTPAALSDYLSGLLIGHELASGLALAPHDGPLVLVGDERLCSRYRLGLRVFDRDPDAALVDSGPLGLFGLARSRGLI
jgi:2-dehydro-3-deoxygalactonokinase